jgi:D-alanyl-D-alanine carboxypeptidase (penicillin-binding protein 5/6)
MKIGFASRALVSTCALCAAGLLALAPATALARTEHDSGGPRATTPEPELLYRSGTQVRPHSGAPRLPRVSALSWLVADADTGEVLAAHDAHRELPPASTLKALFALTVLPTLPGGIRHRVSEEELAGIGPGSSLVGLAEGRVYQIADLWRGVFLSSGNDAVRVLAALHGGWRHTAARMQDKARSLGALDTRVLSPDGYDTPGQVSSAYDLAVFGRAGLRNADFARYCGTAEAWFPGRGGSSYEIRNTNRLLTGADGVARYPGLIGIKNGYTSKAGSTLIAAARRGDRTLVVTVLKPRAGGGVAVYEEAGELLDWGFGAAGRVEPVGSLDALRVRPRPGPVTEPVAAQVGPRGGSGGMAGVGWAEAWAIAGAAGMGAGAMSLVLRGRVVDPSVPD